MYHVSHVAGHLSPVTNVNSHSLPPANSFTMQSRLACKHLEILTPQQTFRIFWEKKNIPYLSNFSNTVLDQKSPVRWDKTIRQTDNRWTSQLLDWISLLLAGFGGWYIPTLTMTHRGTILRDSTTQETGWVETEEEEKLEAAVSMDHAFLLLMSYKGSKGKEILNILNRLH